MPVSSTLDSCRAFLLFYLSIVDNAHFVMFTGLALISDIHRCVSKSSSEARLLGSFSQLHGATAKAREKPSNVNGAKPCRPSIRGRGGSRRRPTQTGAKTDNVRQLPHQVVT